MRTTMNVFKVTLMAAVAALACAVPARAAVIIDFRTGLGSFGGNVIANNALTSAGGSGVPIDVMRVTNGGGPTITYDLSGTAAGLISDANLAASLTFDSVARTFTIVGGVPSLGIPNGTTLASGLVDDFSVSGHLGTTTTLTVDFTGTDTLANNLLTALGLPMTQPWIVNGSVTGWRVGPGRTFTATSTSLSNTVTPEPGSLMFFGGGLVGLAAAFRRRKK
jgi:hypothetical protein